MKSPPSIWDLLHNVKSTVKILSIFVVFLENMSFKIKWEILSNFRGLLKICELYAIRERMLEKQKKCPKGKVSLHLNRKLFRRLPLDFHGKITLIDSPSTSVLVRYTQYPIMYIRTDRSNDPFITWIWISPEIYFWENHLTNLIKFIYPTD